MQGGHIEIKLIIEITKLELTGDHMGIMLTIEMEKTFLGGYIGIRLFIEIAIIELNAGHIGIMLFIKITK